MRYRVTHRTRYLYQDRVIGCHNQARLLPRYTPDQQCLAATLAVVPEPAVLHEHRDGFGNRVHYFAVEAPHQTLEVTAVSELRLDPVPESRSSPPWDRVADDLARDRSSAGLAARELVLASPFVVPDRALADYARPSFPPGRPLLEAVQDLTRRIHADFAYDPHFTTVVTPLAEVLDHRRGVCQDFAHLAIGGLRAMGLAARYVSGYLETLPPPGQPKLQGVDASHAWFAVHLPGHGWYDFDPTNDQMRTRQYVTTAWGRDYGDVTPLKGVLFGGGHHELEVAVDVERLPDNAP